MMRPSTVCVLAILFIFCCTDKPKTANHEITDSAKNSIAESPAAESTYLVPRYPFRLTVHEGSNWSVKIDSVTDKDFNLEEKVVYQEKKVNGDSLVTAFSIMFKDVVTLTDSCCILKGWNKDLKMCRKRPSDEKEWTGYNGVDYDHGYLILTEWGYENWSFVTFNPTTRKYLYTAHEPRFITNDLIYSAGNYYAEGQFQIGNIEDGRYFGFETFNWELTGFYKQDRSILMEFTSYERKKYLKVSF